MRRRDGGGDRDGDGYQYQPKASEDAVRASAARLRNNWPRCSDSCDLVVKEPAFADFNPNATYVTRKCDSRLYITSFYLCLRVYCDGFHASAGLAQLNATCVAAGRKQAERGGPPLSLPVYEDVVGRGTPYESDEAVAAVRRLTIYEYWDGPRTGGSKKEKIFEEAVVPVPELYENAYDTLDDWSHVHRGHMLYGLSVLLFWVVVVAWGLLGRFLATASRAVRRLQALRRRFRSERHHRHNHHRGYESLSSSEDIVASALVASSTASDDNGNDNDSASASMPLTLTTNTPSATDGDDDDDNENETALAKHDSELPVPPETALFSPASPPSSSSSSSLSSVSPFSTVRRATVTWVQRHLALPATFGYRCAQDFFGWYTVPPRVQSLTLTVFIVLNIVSCTQGYRSFEGNLYFPSAWHQLYRYISDRTGLVSYANFPLIWLFGMRNNLLMGLTGWDFGTFNNFHRWVARVSTAQAIAHSIGYTLIVVREGGFPAFISWWQRFFWWTGGVATISMSFLLVLSLFWMRRHVYELFLLIHIGLSVLVLAGMYFHVSIFHGRYDPFIWVCCLIWATDRVFRLLRILAFNPALLLGRPTRATVSYDTRTNIIRLVVPYARLRLYQPAPGTFYYLHVLDDKRCWESHPFTVASVSSQAPSSSSSSSSSTPSSSLSPTRSRLSPTSSLLSHPAAAAASAASSAPPAAAASAMTFLIRPYDGFTARLRDKAAHAPSSSTSLRVLVDGPYGHPFHLDEFSSVLFVVGGSGIVVPTSYISGLASFFSSSFSSAFSPPPPAIHIVWAVREAAFAADVLRADLKDYLSGHGTPRITLDVYVTRSAAGEEARLESMDAGTSKNVRVFYGRPDVHAEIECSIQQQQQQQQKKGASTDDGTLHRLAVVACGPARLADDSRRAVVDLLGRRRGVTSDDVEYFEESFQW